MPDELKPFRIEIPETDLADLRDRLRRSTDLDSAPLLAASIFLDVLNVFLFFLRIFSRNN